MERTLIVIVGDRVQRRATRAAGGQLRFEFHRSDPAWPVDTLEITAFMRGRGNSWVQDEGPVLFLLVETNGVDWRRAILGPRMESPLRSLAHALGLEW